MPLNKILGAAAALTLAGLTFAALIVAARPGFVSPPFFYNTSLSLPRGLYRVEVRESLAMGDIIRTCAPAEGAALALKRGYLLPGSCPGGTARIGKMVVGMAGDTVRVTKRGIIVRGRVLVRSVPLDQDTHGRTVRPALGKHVVARGQCFVLSSHSLNSYDSRYYGPVDCAPPHYVLQATTRQAKKRLARMRRAVRIIAHE